jgi:hypothetical protein
VNRSDTAARLVSRHGTTWCEEAGIRLADKPSPLWRLFVLSLLLSARISSDIAVAAARELSKAGMRTPHATAQATWQQRVDALGRGHYRRYDERTSTQLGEAAQQLLDHRRVNDSRPPDSLGGIHASLRQGGINREHEGPARLDTADFSDTEPGNLRVDYVLPSTQINIRSSAVFWPTPHSPLFRLTGDGNFPFPSSDHRLVWADLRIPG